MENTGANNYNQMPLPGQLTQNFDGKNGNNDIWKWIWPFIFGGGIGHGYGGGYGLGGGYGYGGQGGYAGIANALSPVNQNVEALRDTVRQNTSTGQFNTLTQQIGSFKDAFCSANATTNSNLAQGFKDLCMQIANCCCENRVATERTNTNIALASRDTISAIKDCCCDVRENIANVNTTITLCSKDTDKAICDQTAALTAQSTANTQAILNSLSNGRVETLQSDLAQARMESCVTNGNAAINATLQAILAALSNNNHGGH